MSKKWIVFWKKDSTLQKYKLAAKQIDGTFYEKERRIVLWIA
jgi:hypothetical protein